MKHLFKYADVMKKQGFKGFTFAEVALSGILMLVGLVAIARIFQSPLQVPVEVDGIFRERIIANMLLHQHSERAKENQSYTLLENSFVYSGTGPYMDGYNVYYRIDSSDAKSINDHHLLNVTLVIGNTSSGGGSAVAGYYAPAGGGGGGGTVTTIDICFIITNSSSTNPYIDNIKTNLNSFATKLVSMGIDPMYSIDISAGNNTSAAGNPHVDCADSTSLYLDSTSDVAVLQAKMNALSTHTGNKVDPFNSLIEASANDGIYAIPGTPACRSAGTPKTKDITTPGWLKPDEPTRRTVDGLPPTYSGVVPNRKCTNCVPMYQILVTDDKPDIQLGAYTGYPTTPAGFVARATAIGNNLASQGNITTWTITPASSQAAYKPIFTATGGGYIDVTDPNFGVKMQAIADQIYSKYVKIDALGTYISGEAGRLTFNLLNYSFWKPGF